MVNFCQPSHEFTFGVGMNFISYPLVLTPRYNKFVRACWFWSLMFIQELALKARVPGKVHQAHHDKTLKPSTSQAMK
jgi:hypothetical protein